MSEHGGAVALDRLAEGDSVYPGDKAAQLSSPHLEGDLAPIGPAEVQQIEGDQ